MTAGQPWLVWGPGDRMNTDSLQRMSFLTTFDTYESSAESLPSPGCRHAGCRCPRCWISLLFSAVSLEGNPCTASPSTHILFICFLVCLFLSSPFILDKSVTMKKIGQAQPWPMFSNLYDEFHVRTFHSYTKCYSEWLVGKAQPMLLPWYHICGPEVIRESCFPCKKLLTPCPSIWWTPKHP